MSLTKYTNAALDVRGGRLLETSEVSVERQSNSQENKSLAKGWCGDSPGAPIMMLKFTNGVPAAGFEYDAGADLAATEPVPFTIYAGSSFLTSEGVVVSDNFSKGVDKPASYEITIKAILAQWQRQ